MNPNIVNLKIYKLINIMQKDEMQYPLIFIFRNEESLKWLAYDIIEEKVQIVEEVTCRLSIVRLSCRG